MDSSCAEWWEVEFPVYCERDIGVIIYDDRRSSLFMKPLQIIRKNMFESVTQMPLVEAIAY